MKEIFYAKKYDFELKTKGFVKVKLGDNLMIERLKNDYENLTPKEYKKSYTSFEIPSKNSKKEIDISIKNILTPALNNLLSNYVGVWGNFMIKAPKSQNMELHADWSYVSEPKAISLNVWMPLQDTSIKNGTLWVVPCSHNVIKSIRGINLPRFYFKQNDLLKGNYGIPLNCKKGEAIIYDHRLIHYSYPNFSNFKRLAATLIMTPKNEPIFYYWFEKNTNKIEKYLVKNMSFFLETGFDNKPKEEPIERLSLDIIKEIKNEDINNYLVKVNRFKLFYQNWILRHLQGSIKA